MFHEKDFEDIISKYPELLEENLTFKGRQVTLFGRRMDLLFEDQFKRKLIIELKIGPIKDQHIGQILSYEGMLLSSDDPTIRVMLVGNRVPPNIQRSLDHHGIAWREITYSSLRTFLKDRKDESFNKLFEPEESYIAKNNRRIGHIEEGSTVFYSGQQSDEIIKQLKSSDRYKSFKTILHLKISNEAMAKNILLENTGNLTVEHIKQIINLIDEPYPYFVNGKTNPRPWFGHLLKLNVRTLLKADQENINKWFGILTNNDLHFEKRIDLLLNGSNKINGLNIGFITLMLYILNKPDFTIWFKGPHDGLRIIYPDLERFTGRSKQYRIFNDTANTFAKKYGFEHTELDWILSTGLNLKMKSLMQNSLIAGLDESKYTLAEVLQKQKPTNTVNELLKSFHEELIKKLNNIHLPWKVQTHIIGLSYFCNERKCFMGINICKNHLALRFYTGHDKIEGLRKGNWVSGEDNQGSETLRIVDRPSLDEAISFSIKAYEIAQKTTINIDSQPSHNVRNNANKHECTEQK